MDGTTTLRSAETGELAKALAAEGAACAFEIFGSPGYFVTETGRAFSMLGGKVRFLKGSKAGWGYLSVCLGAKGRRAYIHRLMAETFLAPPLPEQTQIRHLDGDCLNNDIRNLAWGTPLDNAADMKRHGRTAVGERNPMARLTWERVAAIRARLNEGVMQRQVAREFDISPMAISRIARGLAWRNDAT